MNLEDLHRREYGRIHASLIRVVRDISLAEDALQEAFQAVLVQSCNSRPTGRRRIPWSGLYRRHGIKVIDQIRRRALAENKHNEMITLATPEENAPVPLDSLRLESETADGKGNWKGRGTNTPRNVHVARS